MTRAKRLGILEPLEPYPSYYMSRGHGFPGGISWEDEINTKRIQTGPSLKAQLSAGLPTLLCHAADVSALSRRSVSDSAKGSEFTHLPVAQQANESHCMLSSAKGPPHFQARSKQRDRVPNMGVMFAWRWKSGDGGPSYGWDRKEKHTCKHGFPSMVNFGLKLHNRLLVDI